MAKPNTFLSDEWIARGDLAKELGITVRTLNRRTYVSDGIPHMKFGLRVFYNRESVRKWFAAREQQPGQRTRKSAA